MSKSTASTILLDGIVKSDLGDGVIRFGLSGEPHANIIVSAVADAYPRATVDWEALIGTKVSFLLVHTGAFGSGSITAEEGTIFRGSSGSYAWLPKGKRSKGYRVVPERVLDVVPGYGGTAELAARLAAVRARFPVLSELTKERLATLPHRGNTCKLAVFGRLSLGGEVTHEALWLLHSYMAEDDIAEGVLIVTPRVGFSEHGSAYGRDLLNVGGEVVGFKPISLKDALALSDGDAADALAAVVAAASEGSAA